jgi:nitroreductase
MSTTATLFCRFLSKYKFNNFLGIQLGALMLAAEEKELHTCAVGLARFGWEEIKKHVHVPEGYEFGCSIALGYSNTPPPVVRQKDLTKFEYIQ